MTLPGVATGKPYFSPLSGRRAAAPARLAASLSPGRSPWYRFSISPRSLGMLLSIACRSITSSPSTTPRCNAPLASKLTIFMNTPLTWSAPLLAAGPAQSIAPSPRAAPTCPRSRRAGEKMPAQDITSGTAALQVPGVHHGEAKAARRQGVLLGLFVLVKRDLHAGDIAHVLPLRARCRRRMAIARPVRPEHPEAEPVAPIATAEVPPPLVVQADDRLNPA